MSRGHDSEKDDLKSMIEEMEWAIWSDREKIRKRSTSEWMETVMENL